jgi:sec-independent protein translocase protein TatC
MERTTGVNSGDFLDHLEDLRRKILSVLVFFCCATALLFIFSERALLFLQSPLKGLEVSLYYFKPYEKFLTYMKLSFWGGVALSAPLALLQAGLFVMPALRKNEIKYLVLAGAVVPVLFIAGAAFAYRIIAPLALRFFLSFGAGDNVLPLWGFGDYASFLFAMLLAAGLLFQAPLLLLLFIACGVVSVSAVARLRPWIILGIALAAALLTPPDVVSQILLGVPLYLLFELTLAIGRLLGR